MDTSSMEKVLAAFKTIGLPARRAAIIVAVSTNESNNTFGITRASDLIYPVSCYPSRQVLKLERGGSSVQPLGAVWTQDVPLMNWLSSQGYLASSTGSSAVQWLSSAVAGYDSMLKPNNHLARVFEYLMDQRKSGALRNFSIGPTQIYLNYSPAAEAVSPMPKRFPKIEDLFTFYTSTVTSGFDGPWFDYLVTNSLNYPTPASTSGGDASKPASVENYLQTYQTGMVDWTNATWKSYAASFLTSVKKTWEIMARLGYSIQ